MIRQAMFLAVGFVYYLRLEDVPQRMEALSARQQLNEKLREVAGLSVADIVEHETVQYIKNARLDAGIAENKALKENVFAIIVCIQLRMPLIIIGPPGCSKTLSFQIVQQSILNDANVREVRQRRCVSAVSPS